MIEPRKKYEIREKKYEGLSKKLKKDINKLGVLRLIVFITALTAIIYGYLLKNYSMVMVSFGIVTMIFIYLAVQHRSIKKSKVYVDALKEINRESVNRVDDKWKEFKDSGKEFVNSSHRYTYDLDIFGEGSLYQKINVAGTFAGKRKLMKFLSNKPRNVEEIYSRQNGVNELSKKIYFRQKLQAESMVAKGCDNNPEELLQWVKDTESNRTDQKTILGIKVLSTVTIVTTIIFLIRALAIVLTSMIGEEVLAPQILYKVPIWFWLGLIIVQGVILGINKESRAKNIIIGEKFKEDINVYKNIILHIEKQRFSGEHMKKVTSCFSSDSGRCASDKIKKFSDICESISARRSSMFIVFNLIMMLEYKWDFRLEEWKTQCGDDLEEWIESIGEIEALSSMAGIKYDNPKWCMPKIIEGKSEVEGRSIGHPLLGEERVCNDFSLEEPRSIMMITGSNMSGKSTFMRTVGVNCILAYAGAPVCAQSFRCALMDIYSSMKISDNLSESVSSFYAEMINIKSIVDASNSGKQVFFLLDEIFKGTNSADRHTGAKCLVQQLSRDGNIGMVSTHDLGLAKMENIEKSKVKNYHFSEHYVNNEIKFDYRIKSGVSTTRNAVYLMKLAGVDIEE